MSKQQSVTASCVLQVKSLKVFRLDNWSTPAVVRIVAIQCATSDKPSYQNFLLHTNLEGNFTGFTGRRCCGELHVVSSADPGFGSLAAFEGLVLRVRKKKGGCLQVSAGDVIDVDLVAVNQQLQQQDLQAEFR